MNSFQLENTNSYITETFNEKVLARPTKPKCKRVAPVSVRLNAEERAMLEEQACGISLSAHIRERLFGQDIKPRKTRGRTPVKDHKILAKVLSALGRSNLAQDFEALEWSIDYGSIQLSPQSEALFRSACLSVIAMRKDLVKALGLKS